MSQPPLVPCPRCGASRLDEIPARHAAWQCTTRPVLAAELRRIANILDPQEAQQ